MVLLRCFVDLNMLGTVVYSSLPVASGGERYRRQVVTRRSGEQGQ